MSVVPHRLVFPKSPLHGVDGETGPPGQTRRHERYHRTLRPARLFVINKAQHLDNAALIGLLSEARVRLFHSLGYDELDVDGVGIVIADAALQYLSEAFYGEILRIEMVPADFNKYGFDLLWRAADKASAREVARGKMGILFFDYAAKRPAVIPEGFRARIATARTDRAA